MLTLSSCGLDPNRSSAPYWHLLNFAVTPFRATLARTIGKHSGRTVMKMQHAVALSLVTGVAIGALAVRGLHAQAKPPIYQVSLIDVKNADAYAKEYVPTVRAAIKAAGGRAIAASAKVTPIE